MAAEECFYVAISLQVITSVLGTPSGSITRLNPGELLHNQILRHKESVVYQLVNLKARSDYELRVSYPATSPTEFILQLMDQEYLHHGRKLMNIDKITFKCGAQVTEQFVKLTAERTGLPRDPERLYDPVHFNIVLEELHLGLPWEAWKMAGLVVAIIVFVLKVASPRLLRRIEQEFARRQKQDE